MAIPAPALTDADIQQQVVNELKWNAAVNASEIGVAVREGLVTLTGRVDRLAKNWAAERAVLRVRGVKAVANELQVRLPARNLFGVRGITNLITVRPHSTPMPDYVKDRIATALIRNALIDAGSITVTAAAAA
jgi:osmotically-inducible protein OsmY